MSSQEPSDPAEADTLPQIGTPVESPWKADSLGEPRVLEECVIPVLSEIRMRGEWSPRVYLEKYCTTRGGVDRFLVVRSDDGSIEQYLDGLLSMRDLLVERGDDVGWLIDRSAAGTERVSLVVLTLLPEAYMPNSKAFHNEDLRPPISTCSICPLC